MKISANIKYQFLFFLILIIYTIFNGGNNNLSIQINFIFISVLFLYLLKNNNFKAHLKYFYKQNKIFIKFYILFLIFILFQILPLPVKTLQVFSPIKYEYLSSLVNDISFISLSLSPSNTFFQFLH